MKVDIYGLKESQVVRRYVELPKLFDLLLRQHSFFPTIQTLTGLDPFECGMLPQQKWSKLKRQELENKAKALQQVVPSNLLTGDGEEDFERYRDLMKKCSIQGLRQHVAELQALLFKTRVVCNCWHADVAESDAMWKIYSKGPGVMLESTVGRLKASLMGQYTNLFCSPNPQHYQIAPVRYEDDSRLTKLPEYYIEHPWLLKRKSFGHEKEIRISHQLPWSICPVDGGMLICTAPDKLITRIVLSPFIENWARYPILCAINVILREEKFDIPVQVSNHTTTPKQKSPILKNLDFLRFRDSINGGWPSLKKRAQRDERLLAKPT